MAARSKAATPSEARTPKTLLSLVCECFLGLCLVAAILLIAFDSSVKIETVHKISAVSFVDPDERPAPAAPGTRAESLCLPVASVDAHWWILHTRQMLLDGGWRVRATELDNAPAGREVHWSSFLMWVLAAGAHLASVFTHRPPADNVALAALFVGPLLMGVFLVSLVCLAWRAAGRAVALVAGCAFLTSPYVYRTFHAGEADHHGIVLAFCMATALALLGALERSSVPAAAPARNPRKPARVSNAWFRLSGSLGAAALWVSAATAIPVLAGCGIGAVVSAAGSRKWGVPGFAPKGWLAWGVAGGITSLAFYLLEYFPGHARWRLEVNHPFYALSWACGGFLIYRTTRMIGGGRFFEKGWGDRWLVAFVFTLCLLPAGLIALFPLDVFWVGDRFLLALHKEYISEFQNIFQMLKGVKGFPIWLFDYMWTAFATVGAIFLWIRRPASLASTAWIFAPAAVMQALAFSQVRWGNASAGLWVVAGCAVLVAARRSSARAGAAFLVAATVCAWVSLALALAPRLLTSVVRHEECLRPPLKEEVGNGLLLRDIAHRLIRSGLKGPPVVLTGPNSSTLLSYFGNIRTLGTLYWENNPGLHRAARIFASKDEAEAKERILAEGVTHIVIPSWENFGNAYARLYSLVDPGVDPDLGAPFFKSISEDRITPKWLRPFAYPIPGDSGIDGSSVRIFAVLPQQTDFESHFFQGLYFFEIGQFDKAAGQMREALAIRPAHPTAQAYLREAESRAAASPPAPDKSKPDTAP